MTNDEIRDFIENAIKENSVMLFMKGTPHQPACGFSARTSGALNTLGVQYAALDILPDPRIREELSAVSASVADVRAVLARAKERLGAEGRRTILFLDEIHRFNKAQQDALLPAVESGLLTLIGATTENPYFEVNSALLSRTQVYELQPLAGEEVAVGV